MGENDIQNTIIYTSLLWHSRYPFEFVSWFMRIKKSSHIKSIYIIKVNNRELKGMTIEFYFSWKIYHSH